MHLHKVSKRLKSRSTCELCDTESIVDSPSEDQISTGRWTPSCEGVDDHVEQTVYELLLDEVEADAVIVDLLSLQNLPGSCWPVMTGILRRRIEGAIRATEVLLVACARRWRLRHLS